MALGTRGFADEVRALLARARGLGLEPPDLARVRRRGGAAPTGGPPPASSTSTSTSSTARASSTTPSWSTARCSSPSRRRAARRCGRATTLVVVDEYQDTDPAQERLLPRSPATAATWSSSATPTSRSTLPRRRRERHPRLPHPLPRRRPATRRRSRSLRVSRRSGADLLAASRAVARRMPLAGGGAGRRPAPSTATLDACRRRRRRAPSRSAPTRSPRRGARRDRRPPAPRPPRGRPRRGARWRSWCASGVRSLPYLRRVARRRRRPGRGRRRRAAAAREPAVAPLLAGPAGRWPSRTAAHPGGRADLLLSPLGGMDAADLRRLGRPCATRSGPPAAAAASRGRAPSSSARRWPSPSGSWPSTTPSYARGAPRLGGAARAGPGRCSAERRHRRGGAVGAVGRHPVAAPAGARRLARRRGRTQRRPRPRRRRRAVRDRRPRRGAHRAAAARATSSRSSRPRTSPPTPSPSGRCAADAVRLMTAHRSQGPGVGPRRRRRRPGGPAGPTCAAAARCWRPTGSADGLAADRLTPARAPRRGAAAVLRRRHPRPRAARRHGRRRARGRRRPAVAGSSAELGVPVAPVAERPRRPLSAAALVAELRATAVDPDVDRRPARRRPPAARAAGRGRATTTARRSSPAPTRTAGGACTTTDPQHAAARPRRRPSGCPAVVAVRARSTPARCSGSSAARCKADAGRAAPPWASATSSTSSPTRSPRAAPPPTSSRLMAPARLRVGRARLRRALAVRAAARTRRARPSSASCAWHVDGPRPHAGRDRARLRASP